MSLSPFSRDNRPLNSSPLPSPQSSSIVPAKSSDSPLTLFQALTITAGLAGLIGLLSGGVMRFSLSRSSNARFLSPLQTFPTLSDWSSELDAADIEVPEGGNDWKNNAWGNNEVDRWGRNTDLNWQTGGDFDEFSSEGFTEFPSSGERTPEVNGSLEPFSGIEKESYGEASDESFAPESFVPSNFDDFADRQEGRLRTGEQDPLKSLSEGPLLRQTELSWSGEVNVAGDDENFLDEDRLNNSLLEAEF